MLSIGLVNAASYNVSVGTKNLTKGGSTTLTIKGKDVTGRETKSGKEYDFRCSTFGRWDRCAVQIKKRWSQTLIFQGL